MEENCFFFIFLSRMVVLLVSLFTCRSKFYLLSLSIKCNFNSCRHDKVFSRDFVDGRPCGSMKRKDKRFWNRSFQCEKFYFFCAILMNWKDKCGSQIQLKVTARSKQPVIAKKKNVSIRKSLRGSPIVTVSPQSTVDKKEQEKKKKLPLKITQAHQLAAGRERKGGASLSTCQRHDKTRRNARSARVLIAWVRVRDQHQK